MKDFLVIFVCCLIVQFSFRALGVTAEDIYGPVFGFLEAAHDVAIDWWPILLVSFLMMIPVALYRLWRSFMESIR